MKKKNTKFTKLFTFKTALHTGALLCLGAAFFINPAFILSILICAYYLFRYVSYVLELETYEKWKWEKFSKSDAKLTHRKLLYLLKKCNEYGEKHVSIYNDYCGQFRAGFLQLDQYMRIDLTYNEESCKYKSRLYFQGHEIATSEGYVFQTIKWNTKKYPELEKALSKVLMQMMQTIQQHEREAKRAVLKKNKKEQVVESKMEKELAKKIRQAYKKDMSI